MRMKPGSCLALAVGIGLSLSTVIGCSWAKGYTTPSVAVNKKPIVATGNLTANAGSAADPATAAAGTTPAPGAPPANTVALAQEPAKFIRGSTVYTFAVPAADDHNTTDVTAGVVPGGIIWLTPPGFPDAAAHPIADWTLWFTPASTSGGSLWTGAHQWQTFTKAQAPRLLGMTGGHAIIHKKDGSQIQVVGVRLADGHTVDLARHDAVALTGYGHGVYMWQDGHAQLHVVKLATGEEQAVSLPALSSINIVGGGIVVDGHLVKIPLVEKPAYPALPAGYKWIAPEGSPPAIAVPGNWIVRQIPGGSSSGVEATNPGDANQKVTMFNNACAGCYMPGITSPQLYNSFSSPLMGVAKGDTYTWLDEQTVAFTLPPDDEHPYPTYGLTRTFADRSGTQDAKVSLPANDRQTATIILNSMLSRP